VGVIELADDSGLVDESFEGRLAKGKLPGQLFDGNFAAERAMTAMQDHPPPSAADLVVDFVVGECCGDEVAVKSHEGTSER
jgi:hypothetical protein